MDWISIYKRRLGMFPIKTDSTWALPIFILFAVAWLLIDLQIVITLYCVGKREKGNRASNWLEIIAGYDKEQRNG